MNFIKRGKNTCAHCGSKYLAPASRVDTSRYCSQVCKQGHKSPWTPELDAQLKELWPILSARVIGEKLGLSKGAVIGRARRTNLAIKDRHKTKAAIQAKLPPVNFRGHENEFNSCQWLDGEPKQRHFCLEKTEPNINNWPYCHTHYKRARNAYQP